MDLLSRRIAISEYNSWEVPLARLKPARRSSLGLAKVIFELCDVTLRLISARELWL